MSKTKFEMYMEAAQALGAAYAACTMAGLDNQAAAAFNLRREVALAIGALTNGQAAQRG